MACGFESRRPHHRRASPPSPRTGPHRAGAARSGGHRLLRPPPRCRRGDRQRHRRHPRTGGTRPRGAVRPRPAADRFAGRRPGPLRRRRSDRTGDRRTLDRHRQRHELHLPPAPRAMGGWRAGALGGGGRPAAPADRTGIRQPAGPLSQRDHRHRGNDARGDRGRTVAPAPRSAQTVRPAGNGAGPRPPARRGRPVPLPHTW